MSYDATMKFPKKEADACIAAIRRIPREAVTVGTQVMDDMADELTLDLRANYAAGGAPSSPLAEGTVQRRVQGKNAGARSGLQARPAGPPLNENGVLINLIRKMRKQDSKRGVVKVFLQPGVPMRGGGPSEMVGAIMEFGETHSFLANARVRTYLRALALGVAGQPVEVWPVSRKPIVITIRIPARPVWQPAILNMMSTKAPQFGKMFFTKLSARTGLRFKMVG